MLYDELIVHPSRKLREDQRVVFLHLPKTAGTTFDNALRRIFKPSEISPWKYAPDVDHERDDFRVYSGHLFYHVMKRIVAPDAVYLTIFRNPVERAVSHYYQMVKNKRDRPGWRPDLPETLEEFLYDTNSNEEIIDLQTHMLGYRHEYATAAEIPRAWEQALSFIRSGGRIKAESVYEIVDSLAFVGITERFDDSMALLSHTFGWPLNLNTKPLNVGNYKPPARAIVDRIVELNQEDIKLYDYARRVFESRVSQMLRRMTVSTHYLTTMTAAPRSRSLFHTFASSPGPSWYHVEQQPDGTVYVWTGPETRAPVELPVALHRDSHVRFLVLRALKPSQLDSLALYVNGHPVPLQAHPDPKGVIFQGDIPPESIDESRYFAEFAFEVGETLSPQALDPLSGDDRRLGVALSWLEVTQRPADGSAGPAARTLPPQAYRAKLHSAVSELIVYAGARHSLQVGIENVSDVRWPAGLMVAVRWRDPAGELVPDMEARADLPDELAPGRRVDVTLDLAALPPAGRYALQIDLLYRLTSWYETSFDSPPLLLDVEVCQADD